MKTITEALMELPLETCLIIKRDEEDFLLVINIKDLIKVLENLKN